MFFFLTHYGLCNLFVSVLFHWSSLVSLLCRLFWLVILFLSSYLKRCQTKPCTNPIWCYLWANVMLPNKRKNPVWDDGDDALLSTSWLTALFPHGFFNWEGILHFQTPRCLMTWWKNPSSALLEWNWVHICPHALKPPTSLGAWIDHPPCPPLMKTTLHLCQHHPKLLGGVLSYFCGVHFWNLYIWCSKCKTPRPQAPNFFDYLWLLHLYFIIISVYVNITHIYIYIYAHPLHIYIYIKMPNASLFRVSVMPDRTPSCFLPRKSACVACMVLLLPTRGTEPSTVKRTEVAGGRALAVHGSPGFIIEKS